MTPVVERLTRYISHINSNNAAFERTCGLSNGTIHKAIKFNQSLSLSTIEVIHKACPELNVDWLISGNGVMVSQPANRVDEPIPQYVNKRSGAALLTAALLHRDLSHTKDASDQIIVSLLSEVSFYWRMTGDSMSPTIPNGSVIACVRLTSISLLYGCVYFISTKIHGFLVKRIYLSDEGYELRCDNNLYPPILIREDELIAVARVVGGVFFF